MTRPLNPDSLNHLFMQVSRLHYARARELFEAIGVYRGQPPVLEALWERDGMSHSELADCLRVRQATITRMIQRMESTGMLVCKPDRIDQRVSRVYLTAAGREIRSAIEKAMDTFDAETFAHFTPPEQASLRRCLQKMHANLAAVVGDGCQDE